ncbi:rhodanese-like domain-containing protein 4, chloroplastic [Vicia villosa]|uniref:rhodanese-like domain-containing protein 4, chloroplastic n=1 Tax=Vicia villosa TaxID=3911 RepID=UPI00273CDC22|nr:rhodanese-like domain-containing protein 4, chloroplastic [Vicia villosa]
MEALNSAVFTPLSVLSDRTKNPTKISCKVSNFPTSNTRKHNLKEFLSKGFQKGLILAATSVVNVNVVNHGEFAKALTYEEALGLSPSASNYGGDIDVNGFVDSVVGFVAENPAILAGGVAILAVPLVLSQILKKPKPWGVESAKNAYAKLGADGNAQLLDIRGLAEIRQIGGPNVGGLKKKSVSIAYKGDDKPGFLKKLALKFKDPENTTLFILDKFDGNSELVAELVTLNGFKSAYAIKDGAEGPRGWVNSGLPWIEPKKALSFDFGSLTDTINEAIGESDGLVVTLGIAAATGLGALAFSEVETILQLVGSAAIVQFASKKLLFAEDRKKTLKQVNEFLNTKVAPQELVDEIKDIGKALLPTSTNSNKALPAPTETVPEPATASATVQKAEATPDIVEPVQKAEATPDIVEPVQKPEATPDIVETVQKAEATPPDVIPETKVEAVAEPALETNSVPKTETVAESIPAQTKPLSPYPYYPDFKPPTSPSPTQP